MGNRTHLSFALVAVCCAGVACGGGKTDSTNPKPTEKRAQYEATIRWTSHGVPHVTARNMQGLMFGQGYAFAKGNVCILADQVVKLRSERSRFFGPGDDDYNVDTDFSYLALDLYERAKAAVNELSPEASLIYRGFVAGYNKYLADVGVDALPEQCRGAEWVRPIDELDMIALEINIGMLASSNAFVPELGRSVPGAGKTAEAFRQSARPASNGWAIGAERSESGNGMLVANPHFPWEGALTFYEIHLTIPGKVNAYGATLVGAPLLTFGFNEHLGWTHTFSDSRRFTLYRVTLDPEDATRYRYGNEIREMTARTHSIEVKQPDGSLKPVERTLYRSHYGPMVATGPLAWDGPGGFAFTVRDAAEHTLAMADQYLAMMTATNLDMFQAAMARYQTTPYVNTIYADREGNAFYVDGSRVPNMTSTAITAWKYARSNIPEVRTAWDQGVLVVDGSMKLFEWRDDERATAPGVVPYADAPKLVRRDFVFNANDSYWIANPAEPLTGFSPFYGDAETTLSPRSRMNLAMLTETSAGGASGSDGKFNRDELAAALLSNRTYSAELLRDEVVARCRAKGGADMSSLCDTLANWDGKVDLDSAGAVLWREFLGSLPADAYYGNAVLFADKFDKKRPADTPAKLADSEDDDIIEALQEASTRLAGAGYFPATVTLRDVQFTDKGDKRIPIHGGTGLEGTTNFCRYNWRTYTMYPRMEQGEVINSATGLTDRGYPINYGTSFLMIVEFTPDGPAAEGLMTYSSSSDPASPHFADQTQMWSQKQLRPILFDEADIAADPNLETKTISWDP